MKVDEVIPEVREMVKLWLTENGYDALYDGEECGCQASDLAPCSNAIPDSCMAAHWTKIEFDGETVDGAKPGRKPDPTAPREERKDES